MQLCMKNWIFTYFKDLMTDVKLSNVINGKEWRRRKGLRGKIIINGLKTDLKERQNFKIDNYFKALTYV